MSRQITDSYGLRVRSDPDSKANCEATSKANSEKEMASFMDTVPPAKKSKLEQRFTDPITPMDTSDTPLTSKVVPPVSGSDKIHGGSNGIFTYLEEMQKVYWNESKVKRFEAAEVPLVFQAPKDKRNYIHLDLKQWIYVLPDFESGKGLKQYGWGCGGQYDKLKFPQLCFVISKRDGWVAQMRELEHQLRMYLTAHPVEVKELSSFFKDSKSSTFTDHVVFVARLDNSKLWDWNTGTHLSSKLFNNVIVDSHPSGKPKIHAEGKAVPQDIQIRCRFVLTGISIQKSTSRAFLNLSVHKAMHVV